MFLGTDRTLFIPGSSVHGRFKRLAEEFPKDAYDFIVFSARTHRIDAPQELAPNMHAYPTNSRSRLLYGWDALRLARTRNRPDVIAAQDPFETGLAALFIARYFHVPLVIEAHTDFLSSEFTRHSFLNRVRVLIAGFVLSRAAAGNAVSEGLKERICARYRLSIPFNVLPVYVDTARFANVARVPHPRFAVALLWVGRLEREKDPARALRALAAARADGYDVGLVVVGGGSLRESLERIARSLGVAQWVEWAGPRSSAEEVAHDYAQADLLLVTSKYEGYGMVIVEALAAGVPVLATDVGIAREAGALIADGDYASSLVAWLTGSRERGVLRKQWYRDEDDYLQRLRTFYATAAKAP
jgi:glycosyltransferase involved in cell wall biosynthesis